MADTATAAVPTSADLHELVDDLENKTIEAAGASAARDGSDLPHDSDAYRSLEATAREKWVSQGIAGERLRSAIRRAATALDHVHSCDKPTNADLVRQVRDANDRIQVLISERDEARLAAQTNAKLADVDPEPVAKAV